MVTDAEFEALHQTLWRLESRWTPPIPDANVYHAYERLPLIDFLPLLREAGEAGGRTFMDIGCGIGTNLLMVYLMGWKVIGIDHHAPYLDSAAKLVPEATLILSNAFDVESFDADVVYMYRPMVSAGDEDRLENHVLSRMKTGATLLCTSPHQKLRVA